MFDINLNDITPENYLIAEEISPLRHEYRNNEVYIRASSTTTHATILGNLTYHLHTQLRGTRYRTFPVGLKLRIDAANAFYYPDLFVTGAPRDDRPQSQYLEYPCLIIEILSPETEEFDRTEKFADYRTIPTLTEYLLVHTDRRQVEQFQRDDRGDWHAAEPTDPIRLASVNCPLAFADIYEDTNI